LVGVGWVKVGEEWRSLVESETYVALPSTLPPFRPSKFVISFFCRLVLKGIGVAWRGSGCSSAEGPNTRGRDGVGEDVESQCGAVRCRICWADKDHSASKVSINQYQSFRALSLDSLPDHYLSPFLPARFALKSITGSQLLCASCKSQPHPILRTSRNLRSNPFFQPAGRMPHTNHHTTPSAPPILLYHLHRL
jgi:hypothetical protein